MITKDNMQYLTASVVLSTTQVISVQKVSLERALITAVIRRVKNTLNNMTSTEIITGLKSDQALPELEVALLSNKSNQKYLHVHLDHTDKTHLTSC